MSKRSTTLTPGDWIKVVGAGAIIIGAIAGLLIMASDSKERSDSQLACDHYRNVVRDAGDGVLTVTELRAKLREVEKNSSIATERIQVAARRLLASVTLGQGVEDATVEMSAACREAGY